MHWRDVVQQVLESVLEFLHVDLYPVQRLLQKLQLRVFVTHLVGLVALESLRRRVTERIARHFCDEFDEEVGEVFETIGEGGIFILPEGAKGKPVHSLVARVRVAREPHVPTSERGGRGGEGGG